MSSPLVYSHVITKFSRMGSFLNHGAPLHKLWKRELCYMMLMCEIQESVQENEWKDLPPV